MYLYAFLTAACNRAGRTATTPLAHRAASATVAVRAAHSQAAGRFGGAKVRLKLGPRCLQASNIAFFSATACMARKRTCVRCGQVIVTGGAEGIGAWRPPPRTHTRVPSDHTPTRWVYAVEYCCGIPQQSFLIARF